MSVFSTVLLHQPISIIAYSGRFVNSCDWYLWKFTKISRAGPAGLQGTHRCRSCLAPGHRPRVPLVLDQLPMESTLFGIGQALCGIILFFVVPHTRTAAAKMYRNQRSPSGDMFTYHRSSRARSVLTTKRSNNMMSRPLIVIVCRHKLLLLHEVLLS